MTDEMGDSGSVETGGGAGGEVSATPAGGEAPNVGGEVGAGGDLDNTVQEETVEGTPELDEVDDQRQPSDAARLPGAESPNPGTDTAQYDLPLDYTQKPHRPEVQDLLDKVEALDVSTAKDGAIFYSGPGNQRLAEQCARETGRQTLEQTPGGEWLDRQKLYENRYDSDTNPKGLTTQEADLVWSKLSQQFAQQASGVAFAFVHGADPARVFWGTEARVLNTSSTMTKVVM